MTLSLNTDGRTLSLEENNLYLNSVAKGSAKGHVTWFAGLAGGMVWQDISDALLHGDRYCHRTGELHVKTKASKTLTAWMKGTIGMESFFRYQWLDYRLHDRLHSSKSSEVVLPKLRCARNIPASLTVGRCCPAFCSTTIPHDAGCSRSPPDAIPKSPLTLS